MGSGREEVGCRGRSLRDVGVEDVVGRWVDADGCGVTVIVTDGPQERGRVGLVISGARAFDIRGRGSPQTVGKVRISRCETGDGKDDGKIGRKRC